MTKRRGWVNERDSRCEWNTTSEGSRGRDKVDTCREGSHDGQEPFMDTDKTV